jgi:hydroxymethylbilane synthase
LQKLDDSDILSGIILARAGLERLELYASDMEPVPVETMLPAVNQGLLVVQLRTSDTHLLQRITPLCQQGVEACFNAERACIGVLDADCHSAVSAYAHDAGDGKIHFRAEVYSLDGSEALFGSIVSSWKDATAGGKEVAAQLIQQGALRLLDESRQQVSS